VPVIHPNGKFLYVSNFGSVSFNGGGDIDQFAIDGATGALTRSPTVISGGGAQPMGIVFNRLGTIAYVLYSGTSSSNSFSSQVKAYTVDTASGAFTGPISGVAAGVLGSYPWSIAMDPNNKFVYVSTFSTDELIAYSVNSSTGALSNIGSLPVTAGSKLVSLAIDSFARFLFVGRQQPWLSKNLLSYQYNAGNGALTAANTVLTPCPGGGCVGAINVVAEPQGQFVYAVDSQRGLGSFAVDQTTGALTAVNSVNDTATMPVAATGASPVWQSNCTYGCALSGAVTPIVGGGGGGPAPTNPSPPTSHFLTVTEGAFFGFVTSSPAGIDYGPPTIGSPIGPNAFSAIFAANSSVQLCTTPPPQPAQAYDITWTGSCSGTSSCTTVTMTSDKYCHIEFTPASLGVH